MSSNKKIKHLFLNSNPWFSAVSDYSLQIAIYLNKNESILYCSEVGSTAMSEKCKENSIPFINVPIHNQTIVNFVKSYFSILRILIINKESLKYIWVFEGREHTLCAILKIIFPFLWKNKKLIRIRGQAQIVRSNFLSKILYNKITNKIIFAANCVKERVLFKLNNNKCLVHYYCKNYIDNKNDFDENYISEKLPKLNVDNLVFLVIGRYDPIKGHDYLVESFLKAKFIDKNGNNMSSQLIFIGYKANVNPKDIYDKYLEFFGIGSYRNNFYYLESKEQEKKLYIIEEKLKNLKNILEVAKFGIIPSLDSEVICRVGVEFLQSSIPVLSSDIGALPEVFSDFEDLIFKAGSIESLTKKLEESAQLFLDKKSYFDLKNKTKKVGIEKYSLQNYNKLIEFVNS